MKPDKALLQKCIKKERRAQHELYKLCFPMLMPICQRYTTCKDDAVNILNEGFYKVLTNLEKYKEDVPFQAWIKRIMINTIIDNFRKHKKYHQQVFLNDLPDDQEFYITYNEGQMHLLEEELEKMINEVPPASRHVFNLFAIDGYSHKEIAEMLQISEGTSKWHVSEARSRLKNMIMDAIKSIKMLL